MVAGFEFFLFKRGGSLNSRPRALDSYESYRILAEAKKTALPLEKNALSSGVKCSVFSVYTFPVLGLSVSCTRQVVSNGVRTR